MDNQGLRNLITIRNFFAEGITQEINPINQKMVSINSDQDHILGNQ